MNEVTPEFMANLGAHMVITTLVVLIGYDLLKGMIGIFIDYIDRRNGDDIDWEFSLREPRSRADAPEPSTKSPPFG